MLTNGFNHVAVLTSDTERFVDFYREVFDAEMLGQQDMGGEGRLTFVKVGEQAEFNVFEVNGNTEAERQTPDARAGASSTTWPCRRPRWRTSRRPGAGSWTLRARRTTS